MKMGIQTGGENPNDSTFIETKSGTKEVEETTIHEDSTKCTTQVTKSVTKTMNLTLSSVKKGFHKPAILKDKLQMFLERIR